MWRSVETAEGEKYYYNEETNETSWENPNDGGEVVTERTGSGVRSLLHPNATQQSRGHAFITSTLHFGVIGALCVNCHGAHGVLAPPIATTRPWLTSLSALPLPSVPVSNVGPKCYWHIHPPPLNPAWTQGRRQSTKSLKMMHNPLSDTSNEDISAAQGSYGTPTAANKTVDRAGRLSKMGTRVSVTSRATEQNFEMGTLPPSTFEVRKSMRLKPSNQTPCTGKFCCGRCGVRTESGGAKCLCVSFWVLLVLIILGGAAFGVMIGRTSNG